MSFNDIWQHVRDKFPPARAVALLTPVVLPLVAAVNAWLIDHLPFIAEHVDSTEVTAVFLASLGAGVATAYKWLDGRAKWETKQIEGVVALMQADKNPADAGGLLEVPEADGDFLLSQPDDIAESDIDSAYDPERVRREVPPVQ